GSRPSSRAETSSSLPPMTAGSTSPPASSRSRWTSSRRSTPRCGGEELQLRKQHVRAPRAPARGVVVSRPSAAPTTTATLAERVRALAADYEPPGFEHVPDADAAIFLCAVDHRTGYGTSH